MKRVTALEMRRIDQETIERIGIPAICLMENAGRCIADEVESILARRASRVVCIVCGVGNNGGDGFVAARHLLNRQIAVSVVVVGDIAKASEEALLNWKAVKALRIKTYKPAVAAWRCLKGAEVIVDALFGVGLSRGVEGIHRDVIERINAAKRAVLSVDVPSGLDATTGQVWGVAVKADRTITLAYPKTGVFLGLGPQCAGRLIVADIGIPYEE